MASGSIEDDEEDNQASRHSKEGIIRSSSEPEEDGYESGNDDDEEEEEEDEEPKLKYTRMTSSLGGVYRNGDATSTFLAAGDKMVTVKKLHLRGTL
jgi:hypothetical protein